MQSMSPRLSQLHRAHENNKRRVDEENSEARKNKTRRGGSLDNSKINSRGRTARTDGTVDINTLNQN